jgi:hypothetical protein
VLAPVVALTVAVTAEDELDELVLDLLLEQPARPAATIAAPAMPTKIPRFTKALPFVAEVRRQRRTAHRIMGCRPPAVSRLAEKFASGPCCGDISRI